MVGDVSDYGTEKSAPNSADRRDSSGKRRIYAGHSSEKEEQERSNDRIKRRISNGSRAVTHFIKEWQFITFLTQKITVSLMC